MDSCRSWRCIVLAAFVSTASTECGAQTKWIGRSLHTSGANASTGWATCDTIQGGTIRLPDSISTPMPVIWRGSPQSVQILDPSSFGWWGGEVRSIYGSRQVGYVYSDTAYHAAMWSGSASTLVDLQPTTGAYSSSEAQFTYANHVLGTATKFGNKHAALWDLSTGSFKDLNPTGATTSGASATDGVRQGGAAYFPSLGMGRALIWNSSPNNYIDITPVGSRGASVRAMTADTQVGFSKFNNITYAALWHNTAESFINLAPPQATDSNVAATTGEYHAGWARLPTGDHACVWISDSPTGFIDLQPSLGPNYVASDARAISRNGNVLTVVGTALSTTGRLEAVVWASVIHGSIPAPDAMALMSLAGLFAMPRRRSTSYRDTSDAGRTSARARSRAGSPAA